MLKRFVVLTLVAALILNASWCPAEEAASFAPPKLLLKQGGRVAVVGDSITEQKLYCKYIELYLTACVPELDLHCIQLGWSGERAPGFLGRMNEHLMWYKPDLVTTCYGMNDGGYGPFNDNTGKAYGDAMRGIVDRLKQAGATVLVGSPGAVDTKCYKGGGDTAKVYNETLGSLGDIAKKLAADALMPFADVHAAMLDAMTKAKAAYGEDFDVCGRDGVHPGADGHVVMAYAFLKAMGLNGQLATLTVDLKGKAEATAGHKVLSAEGGKVEIESSRYPFCFFGDDNLAGSMRSILPFVPFQQDLNRFLLIVKNLDADKASVTWGAATKSFSKADLEKGVNLAEAFLDNPFCEPFKKLDAVVSAKENFETGLIKGSLGSLRGIAANMDKDKETEAALELLRGKLVGKYEKYHTDVRAALVPVKHVLSVTPEK